MRFLLLLWLFTFMAMANIDLYPKKECELYNNLKHTKNRGNEVLQLDRTYEMLKHHKGQYLLKVEYATPSQRWVDDDCLTLRPLRSSPLYGKTKKGTSKKSTEKQVSIDDELSNANKNMAKKPQKSFVKKTSTSKKNLLALSWHNAFCETHRYKKECKRGVGSLLKRKPSDTQFVLHGLWPQPRTNVYCNVDYALKNADKNKRWRDLPCLALDEEVEDALEVVMPGFASDLHKHEWIKHGTCYGTEANKYYTDAISLINQVNNSAVGKFFSQNIGKRITLKQVRTVADKAFGRGAGNRVELLCKNGLVTELWLHLGSGSTDLATLLKGGKKIRGRCKQGHLDKAGFGR
ncbi:MAG: Ribonuclease I precursor (EC [uncultured Sulfurovum sp.]|uniref:Ribonuclease I (EC) n=1 Tax=uncultured Sulfurovum sp. TaxID=269237 RepID=A0A6S6S8Q7_9BACT|nr:MAG: Ribonuclease I precursor (EC [uncultured Sulfurovum sp.]